MSDRRRVRIEAVSLGALAASPLLAYLVSLARHPLGRFAVDGDYAGLEIATRFVFSGRTLLGPYSRFGFNHPGPLYFFAIAPIYVLLGRTTTALWAGSLIVNGAAVATAVAAVRLFGTRAQAIAAALTVSIWLCAFGNACPQPWNPMVVVLSLLAFLVCAAAVARGKSPVIPVALFFGELVAETHLSTVPTVVGVSAVASVACILAIRRRGVFTNADRGWVRAGAIVFTLGAVPVAVEQIISPLGNVTRIVHFFRNAGPLNPLRSAVVHWVDATSWLPDRLIHWTLPTEGGPQVMASMPVPEAASAFAIRVAVLWIIAVALASVVAIRRGDETSVALLGIGVFASALAVLALRAVVGETMYYLVFWTTAGSTVAWMGVATTIAAVLARAANRISRNVARACQATAIATAVLAAAITTNVNWTWVSRQDLRSPSARGASVAYGALVARLRETGETPIIHVEAAWHIALFFLNELTRDGFEPRVEYKDRWILGRQFHTPRGAVRPLHVYTRTDFQRLGIADCLTLLIESQNVGILVSNTAVMSCEKRPPAPP